MTHHTASLPVDMPVTVCGWSRWVFIVALIPQPGVLRPIVFGAAGVAVLVRNRDSRWAAFEVSVGGGEGRDPLEGCSPSRVAVSRGRCAGSLMKSFQKKKI